MRADIHDGPEHMLQSEAGYIDARPLTPARQNLLQRTAGPYIPVKLRRTQCEQMSSGLPLKADIPRYSRNVSNLHISGSREPYSITSSARASSEGGTVSPRALAVFRLMTSSNLVGCITGKSAGFSPLRIRPV